MSFSVNSLAIAREQMFNEFWRALERHGIPYAILTGWTEYPESIGSDVDFMVHEQDFSRLTALFGQEDFLPGARLLQLLQHETSACYFAFARQVGPHNAWLHLDACGDYRRGGRLWLRSSETLQQRRRAPQGFWVLAPHREFEYYLVKKLGKQGIDSRQLATLARLRREAPAECLEVLARHLGPLASRVDGAIAAEDLGYLHEHMRELSAALHGSTPVEDPSGRLRALGSEARRRLSRTLFPSGLVLAVLGPDGSGKSTVIEHLQSELAPAMRRTARFHLRPQFGKRPRSVQVTDPHRDPPRGFFASLGKMALFVGDYGFSWAALVYPAKVRSTLVVFDRYFHDMLADPVRYRLAPQSVLPGLFACLVPKPDLWLVLSAPGELLVQRKGEITLEAAHRLGAAYGRLGENLPRAHSLSTAASLGETLEGALTIVNNELAARARRRLSAVV